MIIIACCYCYFPFLNQGVLLVGFITVVANRLMKTSNFVAFVLSIVAFNLDEFRVQVHWFSVLLCACKFSKIVSLAGWISIITVSPTDDKKRKVNLAQPQKNQTLTRFAKSNTMATCCWLWLNLDRKLVERQFNESFREASCSIKKLSQFMVIASEALFN